MEREGILLIFVMVFALTLSCAVTAHPGHGTPEEVPSDPGTGGTTGNGSTDTGSPGTGSNSGSTNSGSTGTGSTDSGSTSSGSASDGTQSTQTETSNSQTTATDNNGTQTTGSTPEEVTETSGFSNTSPGGPAALIGLMVVIGLVAMAFPTKKAVL